MHRHPEAPHDNEIDLLREQMVEGGSRGPRRLRPVRQRTGQTLAQLATAPGVNCVECDEPSTIDDVTGARIEDRALVLADSGELPERGQS